ncbi:MAG: membrane protein insertase YidC [Oscillospiraceae bacterium]|nr:membrane protein insertase YidC [Oscillospiraceae bacterium]
MLDYIAKPFGLLLLWLYNLVNNYGVAIFLFALVVKLIMLPFQFKSQKGMMRMQALNPQVQELQKRHEGNQQKLQQEISKLYKEEKVNPMSGCLWMLIPYPILLALYRAVRFPLTTMMGIDAALINEGGAIYNRLAELGFDLSGNAVYIQLRESRFITEHFADFAGLSDKLVAINYDFLGLNLADTPSLRFWATESWLNGAYWAALGLFLIPVVSALLSWLQMKLSQATSPTAATSAQAEQQQKSMRSMNIMMPLFSLWICFSMPGVMGMYWIYQSLLAIVQSLILNRYFARLLAEETAAREAKVREREAENERKRQETERLRAEGMLKENENTSRKKQQARQKAELDSLRAAAIRDEKAAKRARKGIVDKEEEKPASQVGNRRYARGRAYVPDRFTNPEGAEEATAAAAAESEGAPSSEEEAPVEEKLPVISAEEDGAEATENDAEAEAEDEDGFPEDDTWDDEPEEDEEEDK